MPGGDVVAGLARIVASLIAYAQNPDDEHDDTSENGYDCENDE